MTNERAIEILNPEHREHYDSIETVNEACRMGMEALKMQMPNKRVFEKLVCKNINGKPYFSIQYIENGERHIGYSSYKLEVISDYLKRYFMCYQPIDRT